jgi:hypothetical protein
MSPAVMGIKRERFTALGLPIGWVKVEAQASYGQFVQGASARSIGKTHSRGSDVAMTRLNAS